jgi:hypothetical protein
MLKTRFAAFVRLNRKWLQTKIWPVEQSTLRVQKCCTREQTKGSSTLSPAPQLGEGIFPIPIHKNFSDGPRMHIDPSTNIYTCVPGRHTVITITIIIIIITVIIISISISIIIIVITTDVCGTCTSSQDAQSSGQPLWVPKWCLTFWAGF